MKKHKPNDPEANEAKQQTDPGHPRTSAAAAKESHAKPPPTDAPRDQTVDTDGMDYDRTAKLREELDAARDRELRCRAELDNFRKRAAREYEDGLRYANLPLLKDILPVIDNIDRAIEAAEKNADAASLLEGFKLVRQQLEDVLRRHKCERIEALDAPFDPNLHHAVMQQPSADHSPNTVLIVTQNGYQLHDRVVRPSQVIVSKAE
ncbi:MAG: nucleotide exchange factor GrpE [Pirellulaceae bacterium]|nr:nucleotide exchange factor GrpE [Pirellulaceae bacterium]